MVPTATDPILDLSIYIGEAFNFSQPVKMIVCTRQPVPGTRDIYSGADLGHTFITFEQNGSNGTGNYDIRTTNAHYLGYQVAYTAPPNAN